MAVSLLATTRANALINGQIPAPGEFQEVLSLTTNRPDQCSGVLVGPRVVLTAASCMRPGGVGTFTVDGRQHQASFTLHPHWPALEIDMAAGIIDEEIDDVTPATIGGSLTAGAEVTLAGFGCTDGDDPRFDNRLRVGTSIMNGTHGVYAITGGVSGALVCYRDNGGPMFVGERDARQLAGILSFGDRKTKNYVVRLDIPEAVDFLKSFAKDNDDVSICGINDDCQDD